jgi:NADH-quinone oxidoreductase subunit J
MLPVFYILAAISVICALLVVFSKNPVHSVLYLILTFVSISGQYILMNAQFLAVVNLIVYAGAIMVLFLFVLMLLNLSGDTEPQKNNIVKLMAAISGGGLFLVLLAALKGSLTLHTSAATPLTDIGLVKNLGKVLFTDYVVPFEVSSVLFLAAMVGAVMLGKKEVN